ncbi:unnamed protein product [Musa acuminata subsp. malaccensis]|uniref:AT-hook motif nuclear-localized protein n=1 Tax=Musa acuminata subsp. malaccensis TaxID=214687 RepID=A0A804JQ48_MUSAM|nr:unnamed protein product [Musa acuminata subsp. malaccensis]
MALALTPVPTAAPLLPRSGGFSHSTEATNTVTSVSADTIKKARGLPKGFGKKLQMLALGSAGVGFTPHVITVKTGEDVSSEIMDNLKSYHYRDHFYSRRVVGGQHSRTGGLSVSLAGPDGRVLGGGVAGLLTAASPVQVSIHCSLAGGKKESKQINDLDSASAPAKISPGGRSPAGSGPTSQDTLSESSCRPASPLRPGTLNNSNRQGFSNMHWK